MHGYLTHFSPEDKAFDTNDITNIEVAFKYYIVEVFVFTRTNIIPCNIKLYPAC